MEEKNLFVKLKARFYERLFYSAYAFVDTKAGNGLTLLTREGVKVNLLNVMVSKDSDCVISVVKIPNKQEQRFLDLMARHRKNSIIVGWGDTEDYRRTVDDLLCAGGEEECT